MSRYRLAPSARADVHGIWDYIARHSPTRADQFSDFLYEKFRALAEQPDMGAVWERAGQGLRYFPVKSYVIFYQVIDGGVEIVRVTRGDRDLDALLGDG
jgi:toxin ParE1/3/4